MESFPTFFCNEDIYRILPIWLTILGWYVYLRYLFFVENKRRLVLDGTLGNTDEIYLCLKKSIYPNLYSHIFGNCHT